MAPHCMGMAGRHMKSGSILVRCEKTVVTKKRGKDGAPARSAAERYLKCVNMVSKAVPLSRRDWIYMVQCWGISWIRFMFFFNERFLYSSLILIVCRGYDLPLV